MIIKGKSWKIRGYRRLFNYMQDGADNHKGYHFYTRNLYATKKEQIIKTFLKNSRLYKDRKDGVHLYHDIISITRSKKLNLEEQKEKLQDIINKYCEKRCPNNLVVGFLHEENEHDIHYHLMISANEYEATKKHSLTTKQFENAKIQTELYCLEQYPELEQEKLISQEKKKYQKKTKISDKEYQYKKRTGRKSKNDLFKEKLKNIFANSKTKQEFINNLSAQKLQFYIRGKTIGFLDEETGKKHRLKTLDLTEEFKQMEERISLNQNNKSQAKTENSNQKTQASASEQPKKEKAQKRQKVEQTQPPVEEKQQFTQPKVERNAEQEKINKAKAELKKQRESREKHQEQQKTHNQNNSNNHKPKK